MKKTSVLCMAVVLLLGNMTFAATVWKIESAEPSNWNIAENWTNDIPGVNDGKAVFNVPNAAECLVTDAQTFNQLVQGDNNVGGVIRVMDGGSLTTGVVWSAIGYNNTAHMIVEDGGNVTFGEHMWVGLLAGAVGILDINGGHVRVSQMTGIGWDGGTGFVNVNSGHLDLANIHGDGSSSIKGDSKLDIRYGKVTIDGDHLGAIDTYVAAGKITGFGITGNVNVDFNVTTPGKTTITATNPMDPFPRMNQTVLAGDIELSWINLDPNNPEDSVWVDVWLGTDPNKMDVLHYNKIVTAGKDTVNVPITVSEKGIYYWQVDSYIWGDPALVVYGSDDVNAVYYDIVEGDVWTFNVTDDVPPVINSMGQSMITWIDEPVKLIPVIVDDNPEELEFLWTSDPADGVVFSDPGIQSPTVTVDNAAGDVTLTLSVTDAFNPSVLGELTVTVYEDACQAARIGDGQAANYPLDVVPDCVINLLDLAEMAVIWLEDYSLTEAVPVE